MPQRNHNSLKLDRRVWHLAWPMVVSNISVPLLGVVDTAILGHLDSSRYLAAVAIGASILGFVYWAFGFLRMGITGLIAQAHGRKDFEDTALTLGRGLILALAISLLLYLLKTPIFTLAMGLMKPSLEASTYAISYCHIRIIGAPAVLVSFTVIGWFIGRQNTKVPLAILLATNALNVVLDVWFILGLGLQSDGAAWATVAADYLGLLLCGFFVLRQLRTDKQPLWSPALLDIAAYRRLLIVNQHLFVRTLCLLFSFSFFTAMGSRQGDSILAANAILLNLLLLTSYGLDGFAHAAEALTGSALGANKLKEFFATVKACARWSLLTAALFSAAFMLLAALIPPLFTNIAEIRETVADYYPWLVALPLVAVWSYLLDGVFIGATQTRAMRNSMLLSTCLVYVPVWYATQSCGNHGLWLAFTCFNLARGITLGWVYWHYSKNGRWCLTKQSAKQLAKQPGPAT